jgi:hypothetical protein
MTLAITCGDDGIRRIILAISVKLPHLPEATLSGYLLRTHKVS